MTQSAYQGAIEVDFDVWKSLTSMRESESDTYNDVVRRILGLGQPVPHTIEKSNGRGVWFVGGVSGVAFPEGTPFRARYKHREYHAVVRDGALAYEGKSFGSPSAAAKAITGSAVNGWRFWECCMPGQSRWKRLDTLPSPPTA